ncbi:hypothetical protein GCM10027449_11260 [Sinomonas notoginsengisoli]
MHDGEIAEVLALHPDVEVLNIDGGQWSHAQRLLDGSSALGADFSRAIDAFVRPGSSAVVGVFHKGALWASLVVTVDPAKVLAAVTTADPAQVNLHGDMATVSSDVVAWVRRRLGPCSLGLFFDKPYAEAFLASPDKAAAVRAAATDGALVLSPTPPALAIALA